ncbi:hypothetical protein CsSME_00025947 [Camellia sinensis var. sinensis]
MQVLVERYPTGGDVVQVDTWVAASGKNGMRRCEGSADVTKKERRGLIAEFFNSEERKMKLQRSQDMCRGPAGGQGEAAARR